MSSQSVLQFQPFTSSPDVSFWHEFARRKLEEFKLSEAPVPLYGYFSNNSHHRLPARLGLESSSFHSNKPPPYHFSAPGTLYNTNTIEAFKELDKKQIFHQTAEKIWDNITSGAAIEDPSLLNEFFVISFCDLKKYRFHYWFGFPALNFPTPITARQSIPIDQLFSTEKQKLLQKAYDELRGYPSCDERIDEFAFFIIHSSDGNIRVARLNQWKELEQLDRSSNELLIGMADPSGAEGHGGWPARNLCVLLAYQMKSLVKDQPIKLVFLRQWKREITKDSIVVEILLDVDGLLPSSGEQIPKAVGWEKDSNQKMKPKFVDLNSTMNPEQMAISQTTLNLKLMKWRLMPSLDLDRIAETKCLLVGSGTLGCNVARALLGWGVKNITLLDNGKVSYSNPVRQSLFTFEDCLHGGRAKSEAAADRLKQIFPGVNAQGIQMNIPMPGHEVTSSMKESTVETITQLDQLIRDSDVIFLLTDTRESRWLPTVICAAYDKLCINSALGFDTFMVMRHGCSPLVSLSDQQTRVGCYFCNDVVGPQDSLKNRSLDQQCTVTRPGVSMLAASMAVELMVSVLHHPMGNKAPADTDISLSENTSTMFGIIPHQIRGFLSHFHNMIVMGPSYSKCTGCCSEIISRYLDNSTDLVLTACNNPLFLEDLTGLTAMKEADSEISIEWEDDF